MKPLNGYKNVTKFHVTPVCEEKDCNSDGNIPCKYDESTGEFKMWMCEKHAFRYFAKEMKDVGE